jgi:hypothetical protein
VPEEGTEPEEEDRSQQVAEGARRLMENRQVIDFQLAEKAPAR